MWWRVENGGWEDGKTDKWMWDVGCGDGQRSDLREELIWPVGNKPLAKFKSQSMS